ncbi:MAG: MFS transporter [Armatimonadota bacterium]|nr:MFS transporter [Armatimonadota bacterium]MDR7422596.1 MFS transporter [Armatimonadota bacterium]MDR7453583.1 MFS transporter [Armatimonadota bacterium]MDR7456937.1 MFS transporter [Armatimonadota bacterium]MDR7496669.1 MFS transporter [Armatimonadota bacterium]
MRSASLPAAWLANLVAFLFWTGWLAASPFLSLYATALGAGPAAVGVILGGYHIVGLVLSLPAGAASERWGSGRVMLTGCALGVVGTLTLAASRGLGALTAGLVVVGLAQILISIGTQVETIRAVPRPAVVHAIGRFFFVTSFAQILGPAVGALAVGEADYRAVFLVGAALSALGAAVSVPPAGRPLDPEGVLARPPALEAVASTLRDRPGIRAALLVTLAGDLLMSFWSSFYPLLLSAGGYGVGAIATYFSVRAIANTAARPLMTVLIARWPRTHVLVATLLVAGAAVATMPFVRAPVVMGAVVLLYGLANGIFFTLAAAVVASGFPPESAGVGVGTRILMSRAGVILGPILLGVVAQSLGYVAAFLAGAALLAAVALLYAPRPQRFPRVT